MLQLLRLFSLRTGQGGEVEESLLVFDDISPYLFSEGFGITKGIQVVVLQLESYSKQSAELIDGVAVLLRSPGNYGAHFQRSAHQYGGFVFDHFDVFLDGHLLPGLEIYVILLAFAYLNGGLGEQHGQFPEGFAGIAFKKPVGIDQHGVAREDAGVDVPTLMYGGISAAQGGSIHNIVVDQGKVVKGLYGKGGIKGFPVIAPEDLGGH